MKNKLIYLVGAYALGAALAAGLYSCKGEQGPTGPQGSTGTAGTPGTVGAAGPTGPAGTSGAQGLPGTPGKDGNANVVYTEWKTPPNELYARASSNQVAQLATNVTSQTVLTREALDQAAIYVYYKLNVPVFDSQDGDFKLRERISSNNNVLSYVPIPGRPATAFNSFMQVSIFHDEMGLNFYKPTVLLYTSETNAANARVALPEFIGRDAAFFRNVVKDSPQYRIMVVYGTTKGGRASYEGRPVDYTDYAQVKAYFGLRD